MNTKRTRTAISGAAAAAAAAAAAESTERQLMPLFLSVVTSRPSPSQGDLSARRA